MRLKARYAAAHKTTTQNIRVYTRLVLSTLKTASPGAFLLAITLLCAVGTPAQERTAPAAPQAQGLPVKGGHFMGETADQFFSEGFEKQALAACASGDFRGVSKSKHELKKYCAHLADARQQAMSGSRYDFEGGGDLTEFRTDTFTFDRGRLVKVELVYSAPNAEANYRGQSFDQIFAGVKQAYGPPTGESTQSVQNVYGVQYVAHRELWLTPQSAIVITEHPGDSGSTSLAAFTRAEYDRTLQADATKAPNPLQ